MNATADCPKPKTALERIKGLIQNQTAGYLDQLTRLERLVNRVLGPEPPSPEPPSPEAGEEEGKTIGTSQINELHDAITKQEKLIGRFAKVITKLEAI